MFLQTNKQTKATKTINFVFSCCWTLNIYVNRFNLRGYNDLEKREKKMFIVFILIK